MQQHSRKGNGKSSIVWLTVELCCSDLIEKREIVELSVVRTSDMLDSRSLGRPRIIKSTANPEAVHMIRKGQVRWLPKGDVLGLLLFVDQIEGRMK